MDKGLVLVMAYNLLNRFGYYTKAVALIFENRIGIKKLDHAETFFSIVLDVDWAPDFVIYETAALLKERQIRASWFITHPSPAVEWLKGFPESYELGIHPNFLANSSQGKTQAEVVDYCLRILPDTVSMRTHAYHQNSLIFDHIARTTSIENDASIFMPLTPNLQPARYWIGERYINRFPVFWEEDNELKKPKPHLKFEADLVNSPGLKIFAFHPILLYLNSASIQSYNIMKNEFSNFNDLDEESIQPFVNRLKTGTRDFLDGLANYVHHSSQYHLIRELPNLYNKE